MPRERIYADNAEKQAAYNERKRQIRLETERKEQEELRRIAQLQRDCRRAIGALIETAPTSSVNNKLAALGYTETDAAECQAYINRISNALKAGMTWIP